MRVNAVSATPTFTAACMVCGGLPVDAVFADSEGWTLLVCKTPRCRQGYTFVRSFKEWLNARGSKPSRAVEPG